ncbi:Hypothetical predicted protein [Podarcis lilfordi]|uniref:Uncharacterized protein n=1 Tax=Podarcis lilfordi TaxID=74358 RepID=A0AA35PRR6_9SAUR|nr:Hypothetical predicted protein [Podarcis lilfordi]
MDQTLFCFSLAKARFGSSTCIRLLMISLAACTSYKCVVSKQRKDSFSLPGEGGVTFLPPSPTEHFSCVFVLNYSLDFFTFQHSVNSENSLLKRSVVHWGVIELETFTRGEASFLNLSIWGCS